MVLLAVVPDLLSWEWIDQVYAHAASQVRVVLSQNAYDPKMLFWAALGAVLVLVAVTFLVSRRRKTVESDEAHPGNLEHIMERYRSSESQRFRGAAVTPGQGKADDTAPMAMGSNRPATPNSAPWLEFLEVKPVRVRLGRPEITIGRHSSNDIVLDDDTVHRHHANIVINGNSRCELRHQGGANGSFVNGELCEARELQDGDLIQFGSVKIRFGAAGSTSS